MDRRKKLATAGAVSLTATAAVVALGASVGLFGLTQDSPRVGKLSPIDSTHTTSSTTPDTVQTIIVDDPAPAAPGGTAGDDRPGATSNTTPNTTPSIAPHSDDRPQTTVGSAPQGDDHDTDEADDSSHSDDDSHDSSSSGVEHDDD